MGVITLSINDEDELLFRQLAENKFGKTKGSLSKTLSALLREKTEKTRLKIKMNDLKNFWLNNSINMKGGKAYESRSELYNRY